MPTKPAPNVNPPGLTLADRAVERKDAELAAAGRELADDLGTSRPHESSSPAEDRAAERTARRRQRAEARDVVSRRGALAPQSRIASGAETSMLRGALPVALIAVIAGGVLGAGLGALSAGGWLIGLLVAGLTVIVLRALGSYSGSTRGGGT